VYPRRLIFVCRRFGTIYLLHLQRLDMKPAFEDGTDRWFRNVSMQKSEAGDTPKRLLTISKTRRKFEIKNVQSLLPLNKNLSAYLF
jgi:hypothetical protein